MTEEEKMALEEMKIEVSDYYAHFTSDVVRDDLKHGSPMEELEERMEFFLQTLVGIHEIETIGQLYDFLTSGDGIMWPPYSVLEMMAKHLEK